MERKPVIFIGGGGHCKSVLQVAKVLKLNIKEILDIPEKLGQELLGVPIIGKDDDLKKYLDEGCDAIITIGSVKNNDVRKKKYDDLVGMGFKMSTIISDKAIISEDVEVGEGTVILNNAVVNASARIGRNCIINTGCIIEHDCVVEDHCHIAPGSILGGGVIVRELGFVGSGAIVKQGVKIANSSVIGAGSIVLKNTEEYSIYVGNPAVKIEENL